MQASRTRRMRFLRAERMIIFDCCQSHGCTAKWLRREGAVGAGRSRRPRRMRVCGAGSTRIQQTGMEEPAMGAAATERWSGRGPGMRHGVEPLTASELESLIKLRRARRSPANASLQIRTGPGRSEPGSDFGCDYWSVFSPFVSSGLSPFVRKLLPWMTIASRFECQFECAINLSSRQPVDHVDHSCEAHRDSPFTRGVTQCGHQMCFSGAR